MWGLVGLQTWTETVDGARSPDILTLTKQHIDDLVIALRASGRPTLTGKTRNPWKPRTVNYTLSLLTAILDDQMRQGHVVRNVAALVTRIPSDPKAARTLTAGEVDQALAHIEAIDTGPAAQPASGQLHFVRPLQDREIDVLVVQLVNGNFLRAWPIAPEHAATIGVLPRTPATT